MTANIRGTLILDLVDFLKVLQADPEQVFRASGVPLSLNDHPDARVPVEAPMALLETAAKTLEMQDFGLQFAAFRKMPDLGPVALVLREKETLGDVLETMARAFHLHSSALFLSVVDDGELTLLTVELLTRKHILSRQSAEMILCGVTEMLRWVLGTEWSPKGVRFRHAKALPDAVYRKHFGSVPAFGQELNALVLEPRDLARSIRRPTTAQVIDAQADQILSRAAEAPDVFSYRVRQLIILLIARGEARADRIAGLLEMDRRTVQRRLAVEGLTFSVLLDEVRRELAQQYVLASDRSLTEITYLIGFESSSVFSRWYRSAFGIAPLASRRAMKREDA
ncbi:AraC family transcriptional regulator [Maritimibacter dapengensis]|uniref:AraC family transcriptional regulator n=1 Tax=Maritimibacter dapengensis TaxID=2836868 RepID=A0ABS6T6F0_9RHOB|nr:AraC family transcriptional regulator [Maritimibacter dapengensis]MBV7380813.1 AraC family transcriptional regulator [Maritimibacter dapengensis]